MEKIKRLSHHENEFPATNEHKMSSEPIFGNFRYRSQVETKNTLTMPKNPKQKKLKPVPYATKLSSSNMPRSSHHRRDFRATQPIRNPNATEKAIWYSQVSLDRVNTMRNDTVKNGPSLDPTGNNPAQLPVRRIKLLRAAGQKRKES